MEGPPFQNVTAAMLPKPPYKISKEIYHTLLLRKLVGELASEEEHTSLYFDGYPRVRD